MRRAILAALFLACLCAFGAPSGAAAAKLDVQDADVFNEEGQALTRVALGQAVNLQAVVNNTGDSAFNGTLEVVFSIHSEDNDYRFERTVSKNQSLAARASANVTLSWVGTRVGRHTLEATIKGDNSTTFTLHYAVAESEVVRGSLTQLVVEHIWFYIAFLLALVLFVAVARHRRTR